MPARARIVASLLALAAVAAHAQGTPAPGAHAANLPDGGMLRANGLVVPKSMKAERAQQEEPEPPPSFIAIAPPDVLAALGDFHADIGSWAEYSVSVKGHPTVRFLLSILPPPMPDGRYWMEIDTIGEMTMPVAMRLLVHGNPVSLANIDRALVQIPGQALFEVPLSAVPQAKRTAAPSGDSGAKITTTADQKIKVRAGPYTADRIRIAKGSESYTVWKSAEVPLFGLVRSEGQGKVTELYATGRTGAHSLIATPAPDENLPSSEGEAPADPVDQGNGSDNKK